jgi:hypothetical protein
MHRSCGFVTRERATYSCPCSQNLLRQSITLRVSVVPCDRCTGPANTSRTGTWQRVNSIPFDTLVMPILGSGFSWSSNFTRRVWFCMAIALQRRPLANPDDLSRFLNNMSVSPARIVILLGGRSGKSICSMKSSCWVSESPGQFCKGFRRQVLHAKIPRLTACRLLQC